MITCIITLNKGVNKNDFMQELVDLEITILDQFPGSLRNIEVSLSEEQILIYKEDGRVFDVQKLSKSEIDNYVVQNSTIRKGRASYDYRYFTNSTDWGKYTAINHGYGVEPSTSNSSSYNLHQTGKNTDVVIIDTGIQVDHPEWLSPTTGQSRLQQIDWPSASGLSGTYTQGAQHYTDQDGHGSHVTSTAAGAFYGWAPEANIYCLKVFNTDRFDVVDALIMVRNWHLNKGNDNPTIVNMSLGYSWVQRGITSLTYRGTTYSVSEIAESNPNANDPSKSRKETDFGLIETLTSNSAGPTYYSVPVRLSSIDAEVEDGVDAGIIYVIAAGNNSFKADVPGGDDYDNYFTSSADGDLYYHRGSSPLSDNCISVGSLDWLNLSGGVYGWLSDGRVGKATYSTTGPRINIWAGGTWIPGASPGPGSITWDDYEGFNIGNLGNYPEPGYYSMKITGTSMASPQVAGMIANLAETRRNWSPLQWRDYIQQISEKRGFYTTFDGSSIENYTDFRSLLGGEPYMLNYPFKNEENEISFRSIEETVNSDQIIKVKNAKIEEGQAFEFIIPEFAFSTNDEYLILTITPKNESDDIEEYFFFSNTFSRLLPRYFNKAFKIRSKKNQEYWRNKSRFYRGSVSNFVTEFFLNTVNTGGLSEPKEFTIEARVSNTIVGTFAETSTIDVTILPTKKPRPRYKVTLKNVGIAQEGSGLVYDVETENIPPGSILTLKYLNAGLFREVATTAFAYAGSADDKYYYFKGDKTHFTLDRDGNGKGYLRPWSDFIIEGDKNADVICVQTDENLGNITILDNSISNGRPVQYFTNTFKITRDGYKTIYDTDGTQYYWAEPGENLIAFYLQLQGENDETPYRVGFTPVSTAPLSNFTFVNNAGQDIGYFIEQFEDLTVENNYQIAVVTNLRVNDYTNIIGESIRIDYDSTDTGGRPVPLSNNRSDTIRFFDGEETPKTFNVTITDDDRNEWETSDIAGRFGQTGNMFGKTILCYNGDTLNLTFTGMSQDYGIKENFVPNVRSEVLWTGSTPNDTLTLRYDEPTIVYLTKFENSNLSSFRDNGMICIAFLPYDWGGRTDQDRL